MVKSAVVTVSYGTSYKETLDKTIGAVEHDIAGAFPDRDPFTAWTSRSVIKIAEKKMGGHFPFIDETLGRIADEGYTDVIVQPTHIMNGLEYDFVLESARKYKGAFASLKVGTPLLTEESDYDEAVSCIAEDLLPLAGDGSLLLMGHGTVHSGNAAYSELQLKLFDKGYHRVFVTTVEGFPTYESTLKVMKTHGTKNVTLAPFMLVAGDHAVNDLAGEGEGSLKKFVENNGFEARCIIRGLGEYPSFRRMFAEHAKNAKQI